MDERHNDCLSASLSSCAFASQKAYRDNNEDPFHQFETTLEMVATIKVPKKMAEGALAVTFYGAYKPLSLFSFVILWSPEHLTLSCKSAGQRCSSSMNKTFASRDLRRTGFELAADFAGGDGVK